MRLACRKKNVWLVAALILVAFASRGKACFVCWVPYQSLLDKIETSEQAIVARAVDKQQSEWQVVRVFRGGGIDRDKTLTASSEVFLPGDLHVLHRAKKNRSLDRRKCCRQRADQVFGGGRRTVGKAL